MDGRTRAIRPDRQAQIRQATEALVAVLLAAVEDAEPARDLPDELYSVNRAAQLLNLDRSKLYEEVAAQRIRSIKIGRRRLISSGALAAYVAARAAE